MTETTMTRHGTGKRWGKVILPCLLVAAGCDLPGKPKEDERPVRADRVLEFAKLYKVNCSGCHGADGTLGPAPPLNDDLFRAGVSTDELLTVIRNGRPVVPGGQRTSMPGFDEKVGGMLTDEQIRVLAYGIKGTPFKVVETGSGEDWRAAIVPGEGEPADWGPTPKKPDNMPAYTYKPPQTTPDSEKIRTTTFRAACASCHGDNGEGIKVKDVVKNRINETAFLALISDQALRRIIITGRPDLGMPDYRTGGGARPGFEPLTDAQVSDLVALLASWRQAGPGKK
jgi:mono/diheme cytochrome c family protein